MSRNNRNDRATCFPLKITAVAFSTSNNGNGSATLIGLGATVESFSKCAIGHCRTGVWDLGAIVFLCNGSGNTTNVSMTDERMRISANGNVGIDVTNPAFLLEIGAGTGNTGSIARRYFGINNILTQGY